MERKATMSPELVYRPHRFWLTLLALALAVGVVFAGGVTAETDVPRNDPNNTTVPSTVVDSEMSDPPTDRLGWENGIWHNETLAVTTEDGLNDSEMNAVVARTMARVEYVRELEFEQTPPVRLISRDMHTREVNSSNDVNATNRLALNTQYESLLLINESFDAVDSRQALQSSGIGAYYSPTHENITMISPTDSILRIQELTLSQELFHAQQDWYFDLEENASSTDSYLAKRGVVEGDANYVEHLYRQRCRNEWNGTCLTPDVPSDTASSEQSASPNIGMVQLFLQQYNTGVEFVREVQQTEGWDGVDDLYDRYPESTEQTIHPEKYPDEEPANLTVADSSTDAFQPLTHEGERVNDSAGEVGWYVSFVYPALETRGQEEIIPLRSHINYNQTTGRPRQLVTYSYDHSITAGWDGDKLLPYVPTGSDVNKTDVEDVGYVYETAWDSESDAEEFRDAYRQLLEYNDAEPVDGRADTFRIPAASEFADAFYVTRNNRQVTIVNAPTVDDLSAIRPGAAPIVEETQTDSTPTNTADSDDETPEATGPGFGVTVGVFGIVALLVSLGRRRTH